MIVVVASVAEAKAVTNANDSAKICAPALFNMSGYKHGCRPAGSSHRFGIKYTVHLFPTVGPRRPGNTNGTKMRYVNPTCYLLALSCNVDLLRVVTQGCSLFSFHLSQPLETQSLCDEEPCLYGVMPQENPKARRCPLTFPSWISVDSAYCEAKCKSAKEEKHMNQVSLFKVYCRVFV